MDYVLGLDVGIGSVGWCVYNRDRERIEDLGVRAFQPAEEPKTKGPLAEARRLFRSQRRRLRRRAGRLRRAKDLFVTHGLVAPEARDSAFVTAPAKPDPWELRAAGLDRELSGEEFARALFQIVKRRGFKSNRRKDRSAEDEESLKVLKSIGENRARMAAGGWRTAGEMLARDDFFRDRKRNSSGFYGHSVDRGLLEEEMKALFAAQRAHGSPHASPEFEKQLLEVFLWQMPFARGDQLLKLVGPCTFEPDEKRAPKAAYTTERFTLLGHINRLVISDNGSERRLSAEERASVLAWAYELSKLTYAQLRKKLGLADTARFKGLTYSRRAEDGMEETLKCENAAFSEMKGYHGIRKAMEAAGAWEGVKDDPDMLDALANALTFYKTDEDIRAALAAAGLTEAVIAAAEGIPQFARVGHLSILAMRKIIPFLEQGMLYSEACEAAGYNHSSPAKGEPGAKLPVIHPDEVRNPVVLRALSQSRKVINAVIRKHGMPSRVHIELAREVGKSGEARNEIAKAIEQNRASNERDRERFREDHGRDPSTGDLIAYRLYREQNGKCAYCDHRDGRDALDVNRLFEPHYAEVDHILPYSRSFDDSLANRALVCARCNQEKRNRTPHEWFGADEGRWEAYGAWVRGTIRHPRKRNCLLAKDYLKRQDDFMERNLKDTQYVARFLADYIRQNLRLADPEDKAPVLCLNGRVVSIARGLWGIAKVRAENDLHHAADAAVIAALTPRMLQRITAYHQAIETGQVRQGVDYGTGEVTELVRGRKFTFPPPWEGFRSELLARLSDDPAAEVAKHGFGSYAVDPPQLKRVLVSRMPCRGVGGALHAETVRSVRLVEGRRVSVVRRALTSLKPGDLETLCDTSGVLKAALAERLALFGGNAQKAFAEPFYWPEGSGREGRVIKAVRVTQAQPSGIEVRGGVAENESMVRADVFVRDGKFWVVPVYASHVAAGVLPNRAIVAHKPESEWQEMTEDFQFLFTLRPYDLVRMVNKKDEVLGYYRGTHRGTSELGLSQPNNNDVARGHGPRLAFTIEKLAVTVLGDIYRPGKEKRHGVANDSDNQPGPAAD